MNRPVRKLGTVSRMAVVVAGLLMVAAPVFAQRTAPTRPAPQRTSRPAAPMSSGSERVEPRYLHSHERMARSSVRVLQESVAPEVAPEASPEELPGVSPDVIFEGDTGWDDSCGCAGGACSGAGACGPYRGCLIPCPDLCFRNLEIVLGTQGFTGPSNRGETASFGFNEGANWGAPLPCFACGELGMQVGVRTVQSNLSGAEYTTNERHQTFLTGGLFRRVDWGLQGGLVFDYLHEDWYYDTDLVQLRGELSWLYPCNHEIGCWFTSSTNTEEIQSQVITTRGQTTTVNEVLNPTDLYAFFYRHRLDDCGAATGRVYGGFTGKGDGVLGADLQMPFNDCWALQSGVIYLIPKESTGDTGHVEESWNFGLSVVWRPGGGFMSQNYYRPLFNVADNGTFMVDRR